jgi:hypothetical protein
MRTRSLGIRRWGETWGQEAVKKLFCDAKRVGAAIRISQVGEEFSACLGFSALRLLRSLADLAAQHAISSDYNSSD